MKITFLIKKTLLSISILIIFFLKTKAQDYNFSSEYNTIRWPLSLSLQGGITGDDGNYKRLTLFHGNAISFETGSNTIDYSKTRMVIDANGNVGIGTKNPQGPLSVKGPSVWGQIKILPTSDNAEAGLSFSSNSSDADFSKMWFMGVNGWGIGQKFAIGSSTTGAPSITFINGGNIGIGTTSPDTKLTVNGTVHAKEVKVDVNIAPDYVFEKNYKIKPLAEVKNYIAANKHLPEIPSAKNMEKDGVNLSEIDMKLLQKVEELTLYLIDKDSQILNQQKQIDNQQKRLTKLERQIHASNNHH